ncbi:hypothetical protein B0T18DRAFT_427239 [Schizothecium vesticola]|uniref:Uncharacterized protein n=1 Tax=Schizothecium vesticola TaxID=314040 RepID=A0AA40F0V3_9PEZI|nr:hypothetical protein B0T18DRAFT_427239 [Schizothecium vesticola]
MALWNPDQLLSIAGKARPGELQCSAINTSDGRRCGWQKWSADPDNRAVQALLPSLAATPPGDITPARLMHLAELCLCRDKPAHASQQGALAARWRAIIRRHVAAQQQQQQEKRPRTPERDVLARAAYPSPASSPDSAASSSHRASSEISFEDDIAVLKSGGAWAVPAEEELEKTKEQLRVVLAEKTTLERDRATATEIAEQLLITCRAVQDEKSELQSAVEAREKEMGQTRERAGEAEREATRLRVERDDAQARLAGVEEEKQRFVGAVEAAQEALGEMRTGMDQLEKRVALLESDKEAFRQHLHEMSAELATEKTRVLKLLNRLAVDEKRDAGREVVPARKTLGEDGWKTRVQLWLRRLGGAHGKRPKVSKYDV